MEPSQRRWWEAPATAALFLYEIVHESLGWVGMLVVGAFVVEAAWNTGSDLFDLGVRFWQFVQDVFTKPFDARTAAGGGAILLSAVVAWYKTGAMLAAFKRWLDKRKNA